MQEARETPLPAADREVTEKAGKEEFGRLYEEHLSRVYRYVYTWVRSREEAEDLTSEIFLKALQFRALKRAAEVADVLTY